MRVLTPRCGGASTMKRAGRQWSAVVGFGLGSCSSAAPRHATRTGRRRVCITRRPRRTIGRLCCPIARTLGVRYRTAGAEQQRNDPDAKPACGTPRARRRAAAVVSSLVTTGRGTPAQERERGPGGLQAGGSEANHRATQRRRVSVREQQNKSTKNIPPSRPESLSDDFGST